MKHFKDAGSQFSLLVWILEKLLPCCRIWRDKANFSQRTDLDF